MFFTEIDKMMTESVDMTLVIRKGGGRMTVSALPRANGLKDDAQNRIIPLTMTGTAQELDEGFIPNISQPLSRASGLLSNMAEFEQQAEVAAANSKAVKEAKAAEAKEKKERREKHDRQMKKTDELIASKNYKEALTVLQQMRADASEDELKAIDEKLDKVREGMCQGSLFGEDESDQCADEGYDHDSTETEEREDTYDECDDLPE